MVLEGDSGVVPSTAQLKFDASKSTDPADPSNADAMRFEFSCERQDNALLPCFSDLGYIGSRSAAVWAIDASKLTPNVIHVIKVTASKGAGDLVRSSVASVMVIPSVQKASCYAFVRLAAHVLNCTGVKSNEEPW